MATTQYIGARYVPLFANPLDWSIDSTYEALTIVYDSGNSYTSRQAVPKGVDITDTKYWALTGNYNAQIEAYRKEVAAYDGRITENASAIAKEVSRAIAEETSIKSLITKAQTAADNALSLAQTNEKDIATLDSEMAGTADSGLKTLITNNASAISAEAARAGAAEQTNTSAIFERAILKSNVIHFGAIDLSIKFPNQPNPQGMCIKGDTLVCVTTNSSDSNACVVFDIDRKTGAITKTTNVNWGHANGLCYDADENCIYVCTNYDYAASAAQVKAMLKVNASTYATINTITFDFEPHSICIDPITKECFITAEEQNPFAIKLYKVTDKTKWTTELIGVIDTNMTTLNFLNIESFGAQNIRSYNGELWYLDGGGSANALINIDPKDASIKRVISDINKSWIYSLTEAECFDFTNDGDIYLWSLSKYHSNITMGVVSMINVYGGKCVTAPNAQISASNVNIYLNPSYSDSICKFGTSTHPFTNIFETILAFDNNVGVEIRIVNDCTIPNEVNGKSPLRIKINGGATLTLTSNMYFPYIYITQYGSGTATLNVSSTAYIGEYINLEKLTVTGETLHITRGLLTSLNVTGGTFDGDNHAGLFKSTGSTGTYSRFIASSVS